MAKRDNSLFEQCLRLTQCFQKLCAASINGTKYYKNITNKSTLSEQIYVSQLFLLLQETKGYNLHSVICSGSVSTNLSIWDRRFVGIFLYFIITQNYDNYTFRDLQCYLVTYNKCIL